MNASTVGTSASVARRVLMGADEGIVVGRALPAGPRFSKARDGGGQCPPYGRRLLLPAGVLLIVVLQILAALDRPPPLLVVAEPLDGGPDRLLEAVFRL